MPVRGVAALALAKQPHDRPAGEIHWGAACSDAWRGNGARAAGWAIDSRRAAGGGIRQALRERPAPTWAWA